MRARLVGIAAIEDPTRSRAVRRGLCIETERAEIVRTEQLATRLIQLVRPCGSAVPNCANCQGQGARPEDALTILWI